MAFSPGNFFRKYVLKNLPYKLLSLAIAILLWWAVGRDQPIEIPMTVPLEFQNAPANLEINSNYPFETRVTLRGPERLMQELNASEVHAVLDLQNAGVGERTFDLSRRDIHVPRNVRVIQIVPAQFHISFDRSVERSVSVQPRVIGTLLSGYGITAVAVDPATVTIVGPEKRVATIQTAMTDPVDATGVVGQGTFTTHAYVSDPLVRVQTPGPIHVTVSTDKTSSSGKAGQP
ncbi:MAG TPA: CdaR family protein [Terriglobales bacterium]|jgi:YbbR domain-containing protein|nr:CdaR family protein [Terriglobales bacterium]